LVTKIKESPVALTNLVIRFYRDVATEGHDELIDELFTSDFVLHGRAGTPDRPGTAPIRGSLAALREAFADLRFDVEDVLDDGDRIAARWTLRGRHVGDFFGVPASGRDITQSGMVFYRTRDQRLAEQWILVDAAALTAA
jgi:steroid delta-isomerase-like uncharacterized protein